MDFMAVRAHNGHINCGKSRTTRYCERDDGPGYYKPAGSIQDVVAEFLSYLHSQDFFTNHPKNHTCKICNPVYVLIFYNWTSYTEFIQTQKKLIWV